MDGCGGMDLDDDIPIRQLGLGFAAGLVGLGFPIGKKVYHGIFMYMN